jgi:hypothetical protein
MKRIKIKEVLSGGIVTRVGKKNDLFKYAKVLALMKKFGEKL